MNIYVLPISAGSLRHAQHKQCIALVPSKAVCRASRVGGNYDHTSKNRSASSAGESFFHSCKLVEFVPFATSMQSAVPRYNFARSSQNHSVSVFVQASRVSRRRRCYELSLDTILLVPHRITRSAYLCKLAECPDEGGMYRG